MTMHNRRKSITNKSSVDFNLYGIHAKINATNPQDDWQICVDHPIVLFRNLRRPNEFMIEHLMEQEAKRVFFRFDHFQLYAVD